MAREKIARIEVEAPEVDQLGYFCGADWIRRNWSGKFPEKPGLESKFAQIDRISHGLTGLYQLLQADESLSDGVSDYKALPNREDLFIAMGALAYALEDITQSMERWLREFPMPKRGEVRS